MKTLTMGELAQAPKHTRFYLTDKLQKKTAALIKVERSKKDSSKSLNLNAEGLSAQELKDVFKTN